MLNFHFTTALRGQNNTMKADHFSLFKNTKPVIGCIHLPPLPGSALYDGNMAAIYEQALNECAMYSEQGVEGLIIENFHDKPFYPDSLPPSTVAALAAVGREIVRVAKRPVGVNALRNDASAALSIATAIGADFIRVNIHMHAYVGDQGIIQGKSYETLRLKSALKSPVLIYADIDSKHASRLGERNLVQETEDLCQRGLVDGIIVTGKATGKVTDEEEVALVRAHSTVPVLIGSGVTADNVTQFHSSVDGFIIGSYFKKEGKVNHPLDVERIKTLMHKVKECR